MGVKKSACNKTSKFKKSTCQLNLVLSVQETFWSHSLHDSPEGSNAAIFRRCIKFSFFDRLKDVVSSSCWRRRRIRWVERGWDPGGQLVRLLTQQRQGAARASGSALDCTAIRVSHWAPADKRTRFWRTMTLKKGVFYKSYQKDNLTTNLHIKNEEKNRGYEVES